MELDVREIRMNKIELLLLQSSLEDRALEQIPYFGIVSVGMEVSLPCFIVCSCT